MKFSSFSHKVHRCFIIQYIFWCSFFSLSESGTMHGGKNLHYSLGWYKTSWHCTESKLQFVIRGGYIETRVWGGVQESHRHFTALVNTGVQFPL